MHVTVIYCAYFEWVNGEKTKERIFGHFGRHCNSHPAFGAAYLDL